MWSAVKISAPKKPNIMPEFIKIILRCIATLILFPRFVKSMWEGWIYILEPIMKRSRRGLMFKIFKIHKIASVYFFWGALFLIGGILVTEIFFEHHYPTGVRKVSYEASFESLRNFLDYSANSNLLDCLENLDATQPPTDNKLTCMEYDKIGIDKNLNCQTSFDDKKEAEVEKKPEEEEEKEYSSWGLVLLIILFYQVLFGTPSR